MADQLIEINQLLKRYRVEIEGLEKQLEEKKGKVNVLYEAMQILEKEKILQPTLSLSSADPSKSITESISEKYKNMSLNKAILNILSTSGYLDGKTIFNELMKNGFSSASSNIKRDVFVALYRLNQENKIVLKIMDNRKKYTVRAD